MSSPSLKTTHPTQRAILGIAAVVLIVIFSNWLVRSTSFGSKTIDLTEDKRHTLTDGTRAILAELDKPIIIRYYATRKSQALPQRIKNYMRKVDALLNRYQYLSHGQINIERLDPQPDTDAEDSAILDGISGQRIDDENLYFGLSVSCLDRQTSIPFLDPANETMLEYYLSSAIANVSHFKKTGVGLMSPLPLAGKKAFMPGQKDSPPWIIYQTLTQRYDLYDLGMRPKKIDPSKISVLLILHPASLSEKSEYLIDQYLLKGGIVVVALDPYCLSAPKGNPITPPTPKSSYLAHLLPVWGIGMDATSVVADGKFASDFGNNRRMYAHLALTPDAVVSKDEIVTKGLQNLYLPLAGGFTINKKIPGVTVNPLLQSSRETILISAQKGLKFDPGLFARESTSGKRFGLVLRLQGTFPTAFPDGAPASKNSNRPQSPENHLTKSQKKGTVYLISDADFICDAACYQKSPQGFVAINNNPALLENILDQCTGSKYLIGSRSRVSSFRPFTLIKEMETQFAQDLQNDVAKAKKQMEKTVNELKKLQIQKSNSKDLVLTPAQEAKILKLQEQQLELRRELRKKQKGLRAKKDKLYSKLTWLTVGVTPTFIALVGLFVWLVRRKTTRAK